MLYNTIAQALRVLKFKDGCKSKSSQVYAVNSSNGDSVSGGRVSNGDEPRLPEVSQAQSKDTHTPPQTTADSLTNLLSRGLPETDLLEPRIEPCLKPLDMVETLADLYRRIEDCSEAEDKSGIYLEQCAVLRGFSDPKMFRRSLRAARQHAVDVHSKVVLASWLRFERREDELIGTSAMDCCGRNIECPKACLKSGYDPESANDPCTCSRSPAIPIADEEECSCSCSTSDEDDEDDSDVSFCIYDQDIRCVRNKIASLSRPFRAMLYGNFTESRREKIYFSMNGISAEGMKAVEAFSRKKRLSDSLELALLLELLSFANRFCCDEMKSACDSRLASLVSDMDLALLIIEYGLEEMGHLSVAACLQVFLRELPSSMNHHYVRKLFCSSEGKEKLEAVGHASFMLYFFLSQIAMEDDMKSNATVMLLERLTESATEVWQKRIAYHQLGVVMLERKEFKDAQKWFETAVESGHVYSSLGAARAKYKRGHKYLAYKVMNSLISGCEKPTAWMYQERAMYCSGKEKLMDLEMATEMDPTLTFPYKYRAVSMVEDDKLEAAILELNRLIGFKVSTDCLELRAWISIALRDYEGAIKDIRALLTLEPNYMVHNGKVRGDHLLELLRPLVPNWSDAECWFLLFHRWSNVDDIGSLALVHNMLACSPEKSIYWFRQSLLLLRLNSQKAAMRSLRLARNFSTTEHERLVYEGWILYDTGHREESLAKAEMSILIQRSFEAFFLKAYILADSNPDPSSSLDVIQILEEAKRCCPSDSLRKGQALNNLGSAYVDCGNLDRASQCYIEAINIKHTRAHQGLARVYHLKNDRKAAYDEMTKLIEKARNNASAYEKRSEYCDQDMAKSDLSMATQLDPLRTYPYRYRAAVLMDNHKEGEAISELTKAIAFKPDLQLLHLRAAFYDSMGDYVSAFRDCAAALCLDPGHGDTMELYNKAAAKSYERPGELRRTVD
ncbi:Ethylene-overproduction protein 1 [Linum perenne]